MQYSLYTLLIVVYRNTAEPYLRGGGLRVRPQKMLRRIFFGNAKKHAQRSVSADELSVCAIVMPEKAIWRLWNARNRLGGRGSETAYSAPQTPQLMGKGLAASSPRTPPRSRPFRPRLSSSPNFHRPRTKILATALKHSMLGFAAADMPTLLGVSSAGWTDRSIYGREIDLCRTRTMRLTYAA